MVEPDVPVYGHSVVREAVCSSGGPDGGQVGGVGGDAGSVSGEDVSGRKQLWWGPHPRLWHRGEGG